MKNLGLMMITVFTAVAMSQKSEAASMSPADLVGQYRGTCIDAYGYTSEQVLFFQDFTNSKGEIKALPISTEHFYDGVGRVPAKFSDLLKADANALSTVNDFVKSGLSGTANNLQQVSTGPDFKFLYSAEVQDDFYVLSVGRDYGYSDDRNARNPHFRNPPQADACRYGYSADGIFKYDSCFRKNDTTVFTVTAEGLTSLRTADSVGTRTNYYSFYLSPIHTTCNWIKTN